MTKGPIPLHELAQIALLTDCDVHDLHIVHIANAEQHDITRGLQPRATIWDVESIANGRDLITNEAITTRDFCRETFEALSALERSVAKHPVQLEMDRIRLASFDAWRTFVTEGPRGVRELVARRRLQDSMRGGGPRLA